MTAGERRHTAPDLALGHRTVVLVEHRELDRRVRAADADHRVLVRVVERGAEPDAGLGARVARRERGAEARAGLLREPGRHRAAAGDEVADALEVERVEVRVGPASARAGWARRRWSPSARARRAAARRRRATAP